MTDIITNNNELAFTAKHFREQLEDLHCPFVEEVDESWIVDLIFRPGEPRIRLLQWLLTKFNSAFTEILDPINAPSSCKMDSRLQRLLHVASFLGLCSPEEFDLIRGSCSVERQVVFFRQILNILCASCHQSQQRMHTLDISNSSSSSFQNGDMQYQADCHFIDKLLEETSTDKLFRPPKLFPPDIDKVIQARLCDRGDSKQPKQSHLPPLTSLAEKERGFGIELGKQTEILQELKKKYAYTEQDALKTDKVNRSLSLVLSELSQQITSFNYFYENDLQAWCKKLPENITKSGPEFKRVHDLLKQFIVLLRSVSVIRSSHLHLCSEVRQKVEDLKKHINVKMQDHRTEESMDYVGVLEESICRLEDTINSAVPPADESQLKIPSIQLQL